MAWILAGRAHRLRYLSVDAKPSFTGYTRRRKTSRLVRLGEILSRLFITVGGIGTIVAIALVGIFLVWVTYPLFLGASVKEAKSSSLAEKSGRPLRTGMDEYQVLGWGLFSDGTLEVMRLDNGRVLERRPLFRGQALTACSSPSRDEEIAFGFADGTVQLGRIAFVTSFPKADQIPGSLHDLPEGEIAEFEGGLLSRTPEGQLRAQKITVELEDPIKPPDPAAVQLIDLSMRPTGPVVSLL